MANPVYKVKIYYDNPVPCGLSFGYGSSKTGNGFSYVGPGIAYNSSGGSYSNVFALTPNNWLTREKSITTANASTTYCLKADAAADTSVTYDMYFELSYIDWMVAPVGPTFPGRLTGITVGFATNIWATKLDLYIEVCKPDNISDTYSFWISNILNDKPIISYDLTTSSLLKSYYASGYIIKRIRVITKTFSHNYIPVITFIAPYVIKEYTLENGLKELVRGQQSSSDNSIPKYGIIANYGKVVIRDVDGNIDYMSSLGSFKRRQKVKMYLDNRLIGTYVSNNWDYDSADNLVTIDLTDDLVDLQNVYMPENKIVVVGSGTWIWTTYIRGSSITSGDRALPVDLYYGERTAAATNRNGNLSIPNFYLDGCSKWDLINKYCQVLGLVAYKNEEEYASYAYGGIILQKVIFTAVEKSDNTAKIIMPPSSIMDAPVKTVINKNYITGVAYKQGFIRPATDTDIQQKSFNLFSLKTNSSVSSYNMLNNYSSLGALFNYGSGLEAGEGLPLTTPFTTWDHPDWSGYIRKGDMGSGYNWNNSLNTPFIGSQSLKVRAQQLIRSVDLNQITAQVSFRGKRILESSGDLINPNNAEFFNEYPTKTPSTTLVHDGGGLFSVNFSMTELDYVLWLQFGGNSTTPNQNFYGVVFLPSINVTMNGPYYEVRERSLVLGTSDYLYQLETNEFMNNTSTLYGVDACEWLGNYLISGYENGRQTATLTCRYGEYDCDISGNIYQAFNGYDGDHIMCDDVVIPQVLKNGVITALSKNPDGTDKEFVVTSSEFVFDGEPLIHLKLIERMR